MIDIENATHQELLDEYERCQEEWQSYSEENQAYKDSEQESQGTRRGQSSESETGSRGTSEHQGS